MNFDAPGLWIFLETGDDITIIQVTKSSYLFLNRKSDAMSNELNEHVS